MKTTIVIPARYGSTRLPGKPLLNLTGKFLIQHVYERALQAKGIERVLVATDDTRIANAVRSFDGNVCLTRSDHPTGTDRIAEVARTLDSDVIVNLQGDEPLIDPASLEEVVARLQNDPEAEMATLAVPITTREQWRNPNCVKVVTDAQGRALYFSRSPIPHVREGEPDFGVRPTPFLLHLGLYAYRRAFLLRLAQTPPSELEQLEKLEQLRVLSMGCPIQVGVVEDPGLGVDTYEDYLQFVARVRNQPSEAA